MSEKIRRPLGRGLSNLFPSIDQSKTKENIIIDENPNYKEIPLEYVSPNPNQPRKIFEEKEMAELVETIQAVGILEPIVVRKLSENKFQIIAGERRFRAATLAGFKKIPSIIKQATDTQALELGIIENIQREELNPIEEARAYQMWMEVTGQKIEILARKVGKDRSTIKNLTRMLKLPDEVINLIEKKSLSVGQARPLLGIGDSQLIKKLALKIAEESWTSRKVEEEVAKILEAKSPHLSKTKSKDKDANITDLEKRLRAKFSAKISVNHNKNNSGTINIHYGNLSDLDRLLELFKI